jgi:hypothetical protein
MRKTVPINVVGGTGFARYKKQSIESSFNMVMSDGGLLPSYGYKLRLDIVPGLKEGARQVYSSIKFDHLIVVIQEGVYVVDNNLAFSFVGSLETTEGAVFISENNANQIAIADGFYIYIYNIETGEFKKHVIADFSPVYVTFQDTYFIACDGNTNQWRLSDFNNGLSWPFDAQHIGKFETDAEVLSAVITVGRQLLVFGKNATEIWGDVVGNNLFPYQRDNSISIGYGCLNNKTLSKSTISINQEEADIVAWLGSNKNSAPVILISTGGRPTQIDQDGINFKLSSLEKPEDSDAFFFKIDGHLYYQINFRSDNVSYLYDFNEQKFSTVSNVLLGAHIAKNAVFFFNKHYFISNVSSGLYEMSTELTTYSDSIDPKDIGNEIPRSRTLPPISLPNGEFFSASQLSLVMEQGNSSEPQIIDVATSADGGQTFGHFTRVVGNKLGNRKNRFLITTLGRFNDLVIQIRFYSKFRFVILSGTIDMEYLQ